MDYYQYNRPSFDLRSFFKNRSALTNLILVNVGIWILVQGVRVVLFLYNRETAGAAEEIFISYLAVPAALDRLAARPWTLLTYMFFHISFWHILFNMLWLYWFGKIFLSYLSGRMLTWVYLIGGIAGGLCYIAAFNLFPVFREVLPVSMALGASASVMAVVTAIAFYVPNFTISLLFLGRLRIVWLAIALFVVDFFAIPGGNAGGHLAHIGGALYGYAYIRLIFPALKGKLNMGKSFRGWKWPGLFHRKRQSESSSGRPVTDDEYNYQRAQKQKRIDQILEKISRGGYESLTKEEKEFLFKSSHKN
jgi:membrane associated rhomboid family serine protease